MDTCGRILLEATVTSVGEGPYYYPACKLCYSKLIQTGYDHQIFACFKCNRTYPLSEVNQRYRLCLTICDGLTLANVTAFGNMLAPYFGCSASELHVKWDRLLKKTEYQMDSGLLKCALEQTMVGSSLLFGFKGVVKKPKGARILLKDVAHSGETSHSQYLGRSKELIAVQIVPQCKSQYPIPVIHHLQKLDNFIQGQETCISSMQFELESLLHALPHDPFSNDSPHKKDDNSLPMENNDSSHVESDLSNAVSEIDSEESIGFSMTCSSENSNLVIRDGSILNPLEVNDNAMSGSKRRSQLKQDCIVNGQTPVSSRKSSWCVRRWLLKGNNCNNSKQSNRSSMTETCDISISSPNFFSPPEQPRHQLVNDSSPDALSLFNFSFDNIVTTPRKYESYQPFNSFKTHKTQQRIFDRYPLNGQQISEHVTRETNSLKHLTNKEYSLQIQGCLPSCHSPCEVKQIKRGLLTLKSRKEMTDYEKQIFKDDQFDKDKEGNGSEVDVGLEETVKGQVSLMNMPESEDFYCFLAAANIETSDFKHSKARESPSVLRVSLAEGSNQNNSVDTRIRGHSEIQSSTSHFGAACDIDKSNVNFEYKTRSDFSFIDMPESEDMDLFLLAANLSEMMRKEGSNQKFDDITSEKQFPSKGITKCSNVLTVLPKQGNEKKENGTLKMHGRDFNDCQISFEDMPESKEFDISSVTTAILDGDPLICQSDSTGSDVGNNCNSMPAIEVGRNFEEKLKRSTDYAKPQKWERDLTVQSSFDDMLESEEFDLFLAVASLDTNVLISESNPADSTAIQDYCSNNNDVFNNSFDLFSSPTPTQCCCPLNKEDTLGDCGSCNDVYNSATPIRITKIFDEKSLNKNKCGSSNNDCLKSLPSAGLENVATCVTKSQISSFSNNSLVTDSKHVDIGDSGSIFSQSQAIQEYCSNNDVFNNSFDLFSSPTPTQRCCPLNKEDTLGDVHLNCGEEHIAFLNLAEQNNNSHSLFSSSADSSSSLEFLVPLNPCEIIIDKYVSSTPFRTRRHLHRSPIDSSNSSNSINYSVDLFSPDLKTAHMSLVL